MQKMAEAVTRRSNLLSKTATFEGVNLVNAFPGNAKTIIDAVMTFTGSVEEKIRMLKTLASYRNATFYVTDSEDAIA